MSQNASGRTSRIRAGPGDRPPVGLLIIAFVVMRWWREEQEESSEGRPTDCRMVMNIIIGTDYDGRIDV